MRLLPPGVKEERYKRTGRLKEYSFSELNSKTLPIAAMYAMQYGHEFYHLIREVVISDLVLVLVHVLNADVSDSFYRIGLRPTDSHKLGIVFPLEREDYKLITILLTLYMRWKNHRKYFVRQQIQW